MTRRIAASVFVIVMILSLLLLIAGSIENAAKIQQQAMAQNSNSNSLSSTNNNSNGILKSGPPEKITLEGQSKPPVLSPEKKQTLELHQAETHRNTQLPSSDQPILGPILGTQAQ
jgi:Tfp pilus assembly protein PilV